MQYTRASKEPTAVPAIMADAVNAESGTAFTGSKNKKTAFTVSSINPLKSKALKKTAAREAGEKLKKRRITN